MCLEKGKSAKLSKEALIFYVDSTSLVSLETPFPVVPPALHKYSWKKYDMLLKWVYEAVWTLNNTRRDTFSLFIAVVDLQILAVIKLQTYRRELQPLVNIIIISANHTLFQLEASGCHCLWMSDYKVWSNRLVESFRCNRMFKSLHEEHISRKRHAVIFKFSMC